MGKTKYSRQTRRDCPLCGSKQAMYVYWTKPVTRFLTRYQYVCESCGSILPGYSEIVVPKDVLQIQDSKTNTLAKDEQTQFTLFP